MLQPVAPPPKPSPSMIRIAQSKVIRRADPDDPSTLRPAIQELTSIIQTDPTNTDAYFMRASLACHAGANPDSVLDDISNSLRFQPSTGAVPSDRRDRLVLRGKMELRIGRYELAMNDLDAAIAEDYPTAQRVFDDGQTKPSTAAQRCVWTLDDIDTLMRKFPQDHRPHLYRGLCLMHLKRFDLDSDYGPVLHSFARAAALNDSSPLPAFYVGEIHTVGGLGGLLSDAGTRCVEFVVPRTPECLALDEIHRAGIRALTRAIAADPGFIPAYALRANALYSVKEYRQAVRDYDKALANTSSRDEVRTLYNDRALAKLAIGDYRGAIRDLDHAIALGCEGTCRSYDHRADAYVKLHDYSRAIGDITLSIHRVLCYAMLAMNVDQFRQIYPEYDDTGDDQLAEKLRTLFFPAFSRKDFAEEFLVADKHLHSTVLPELFIRRGDAYAALGQVGNANREYDRVSRAFPDWASVSFTTIDGKRVRTKSD